MEIGSNQFNYRHSLTAGHIGHIHVWQGISTAVALEGVMLVIIHVR